jgi:hypothetical protein
MTSHQRSASFEIASGAQLARRNRGARSGTGIDIAALALGADALDRVRGFCSRLVAEHLDELEAALQDRALARAGMRSSWRSSSTVPLWLNTRSDASATQASGSLPSHAACALASSNGV